MDDAEVCKSILSFIGHVVVVGAGCTQRKQVYTRVARCRRERDHACGLWPGGGMPDGPQLHRDGPQLVVAFPLRAVRDAKVPHYYYYYYYYYY